MLNKNKIDQACFFLHIKNTILTTIKTIPPKTLPIMIPIKLVNLLFYWIHTAKKFWVKVVTPIPTSPQQAAIHAYWE